MASKSRKALPRQATPVLNPQSLLVSLQTQLDNDVELRASLSNDIDDITTGSNAHLEQLLDVAATIEDDINELFCDLSLLAHTIKVYSIASGTSERGDLDLSEITGVFMKIAPDCSEWETRFHDHFKRIWSMKRMIVQH